MPAEMKTFEVRDEGTHIPVVAIRIEATKDDADYQWRRGGYGTSRPYVLLTSLISNRTESDPYRWDGGHTMQTAHIEIEKNWHDLKTGQVIDVEFVLGLRASPKASDLGYVFTYGQSHEEV